MEKLETGPKSLAVLGENITRTLAMAVAFTFLVWYVQYHWSRRKMYRLAAQRKGPMALPLVGSALYFGGSTSDLFDKLMGLLEAFDTPFPMWIGQDLYYGITKPKDLEVVMNSSHALNKGNLYKFVAKLFGNGLITAPADIWKRHRKIILPTFNQKILDGFVETFSQRSEILSEQLKKESGKGIFDVFDCVSRCTLDILCETAMGISINAQTSDSDFFKRISRCEEIVTIRMFTIFYHPDFIFDRTALGKELRELIKKHRDFTGAIVSEKRLAYQKKLKEKEKSLEAACEEDSPKRKVFLQQLIELSEEGANFTDEELREEVDTFMITGSDSAASMASFILVMLGMHPHIQERVYEEVMEVLGPNKPVEPQDLKNLPYLENVIKETLRLFPLAPLLFRQTTEDIHLESCTIPANTTVGLGLALHRDGSLWPDPFKFDPDRFLPEEVAKRHPYTYIPFSAGPRSCPGAKYAMMAIKTIISTVIRRYRFSSDYKSIEEIKLRIDVLLRPIDGYRLSLDVRE